MARSRSTLVPVALGLVSLALLAVPAAASSPVGTYECKHDGSTIELKDNGKYVFSVPEDKFTEKGTWTADGKRIDFKHGPLGHTYGKFADGVLKIHDVETEVKLDKCVRK